MRILKTLLLCLGLVLLLLLIGVGWLWASISEQQVEFQSDELLLRGTLLTPKWNENAPGVVLIHGSGEVTRKSMMAYAWLFSIKGYAVLAYDKTRPGCI